MKNSSEKLTAVRVYASDGLAEISIVDSQFNQIDSGLGFLSTRLAPGIYRVRWSAASAYEDKLIEVTGDEGGDGLTIEAKMPAIRSSAPLNNTKFGSIDNSNLLRNLSGNRPVIHPEKSCQLLVFLRDQALSSKEFPVDSVSIHARDGTRIAGLADGTVNTEEQFAGIMIGVDPGVYRLRVETGPLGFYELFVFASVGWQTRVFLACDDFYQKSETFRRPSLRTTSILLARIGARFNPDSRDARLAELALSALLRNRDVIGSDDMMDLLHGKFDDPMLGIYGAHLLLQRKPVKWDLYETVCRNLYDLVGPIPDLQALEFRLHRKIHENDDRRRTYVGSPPMLIRSWDLLIKHSRRRFSIIPKGSLSDEIAGLVVSTKPWLMCRVASVSVHPPIPTPNVTVAKAKRIMHQMVEQIDAANSESIRNYLRENQSNLDPIESALFDVVATTKSIESVDDGANALSIEVSGFESMDLTQQLRKIAISDSTVPQIQAPSYTIARSALSLASKLSERLNFDTS